MSINALAPQQERVKSHHHSTLRCSVQYQRQDDGSHDTTNGYTHIRIPSMDAATIIQTILPESWEPLRTGIPAHRFLCIMVATWSCCVFVALLGSWQQHPSFGVHAFQLRAASRRRHHHGVAIDPTTLVRPSDSQRAGIIVRANSNDNDSFDDFPFWNDNDNDDNQQSEDSSPHNDVDWRAFRAKLVRHESATYDDDTTWTYDSGLMIEKGSIVVSQVETTLGCHDLRQPYFCKCVVLIVDHDEHEFTQGIILNRPSNFYLTDDDIQYIGMDDEVLNSVGTDDDEQRGDDSSDLADADEQPHGNAVTSNANSWRMSFGGDLAGLYDEDPLLVCLHNISSPLAHSVSDEILPGVYLTSHLSARGLVEAGLATQDSFYTFYGFCGWDPGQLQREVERKSWYMVSTDPSTLWDELSRLRQPQYDPRSAGLEMWEQIMKKLGKQDEMGDPNAFPELMLKEWVAEMLLVAYQEGDPDAIVDADANQIPNRPNAGTLRMEEQPQQGEEVARLCDEDIHRALEAAQSRGTIRPGMLLHSCGTDPTRFMLRDQFLHKAIILLVQETDDASVGVVLNLPTIELYECQIGPNAVQFPIRYGGPNGRAGPESRDSSAQGDGSSNDDGEEHDPSALLWFHCNTLLKQLNVGQSLIPVVDGGDGDRNNDESENEVNKRDNSREVDTDCQVWSCSFDQVMTAIEGGIAKPSDFMVVQGFCVWEKDPNSGAGGIMGQIINGNFAAVVDESDGSLPQPPQAPSTSSRTMRVWSKLRTQTTLKDELTMEHNIRISDNAWTSAIQHGCADDRSPVPTSMPAAEASASPRPTATSAESRNGGGVIINSSQDGDRRRRVFGTDVDVEHLADSALRAWVEIFLLGDVPYVSMS